MATNNQQTNVQLIRKFNDWEFSWSNSLNMRMPWFDATGTHNKALLTTSGSPTYYPSGSIIWGGTDRHPADWISTGGMRSPGVIWYWVNEDDCDADRKPGKMTIIIIIIIIIIFLIKRKKEKAVSILREAEKYKQELDLQETPPEMMKRQFCMQRNSRQP